MTGKVAELNLHLFDSNQIVMSECINGNESRVVWVSVVLEESSQCLGVDISRNVDLGSQENDNPRTI